MLRKRVILALSFALVLIGGAGTSRFMSNAEEGPYTLESVETSPIVINASEDDLIPPPVKTAENLTTTSLVGRQLFAEYFNLALDGSATQANLENLSDKFATGVADIYAAPRISLTDLKIVLDSEANFVKYATQITDAHLRYKRALDAAAANRDELVLTDDASLQIFHKKLREIYGDQAEALSAIQVPSSISELHLALVNLYKSNHHALGTTSSPDEDLAVVFSAVIELGKNLEREKIIFGELIEELENSELGNS